MISEFWKARHLRPVGKSWAMTAYPLWRRIRTENIWTNWMNRSLCDRMGMHHWPMWVHFQLLEKLCQGREIKASLLFLGTARNRIWETTGQPDSSQSLEQVVEWILLEALFKYMKDRAVIGSRQHGFTKFSYSCMINSCLISLVTFYNEMSGGWRKSSGSWMPWL